MQMRRTILAVLVWASATFAAHAESHSLDTYKSIIDRNPFGLKDPAPPPPPPTNAPPPAKKEDFYLTGISTIGNPKRPKAYLLAKDASKKDYDQKFFNLSVGDRQGDVAMQEIDAKGRRVKIVYQGEERWLSMKDNGVPAPAGGGPPAVGGVPGIPGAPGMAPAGGIPSPVPLPLPAPGGAPQTQPISYPNASNTRRPIRTTANYGSSYNAPAMMSGGIPNVTAITPGMTAPGADGIVRTPTGGPQMHPGPQTDAEVLQQIVRMQGEKAMSDKAGIISPPVPTF